MTQKFWDAKQLHSDFFDIAGDALSEGDAFDSVVHDHMLAMITEFQSKVPTIYDRDTMIRSMEMFGQMAVGAVFGGVVQRSVGDPLSSVREKILADAAKQGVGQIDYLDGFVACSEYGWNLRDEEPDFILPKLAGIVKNNPVLKEVIETTFGAGVFEFIGITPEMFEAAPTHFAQADLSELFKGETNSPFGQILGGIAIEIPADDADLDEWALGVAKQLADRIRADRASAEEPEEAQKTSQILH